MERNLSPRRRAYDLTMRSLVWLSALLTCALLVFLIGYIFYRGFPGVTWDFLSGTSSYIRDTIGILPNILNTLYIVLLAMALVLPLGVGAAIYSRSTPRTAGSSSSLNLRPRRSPASRPSSSASSVCFFRAERKMDLQAGVLAGSLTLVVMILPTIVRTTQESLKTVPQSYREGALALGAGKWRMVRTVVLPNAVDGIVTGCILAVGRIVGESAALLYTAGFGLVLNDFVTALHSSSATLTVALYVYANDRGRTDVAFSIASVLMLLTLVINLTAALTGRKLTKRTEGHRKMSDAPIIEAKGLNLWYGPNHALKDISVAVPAHEITAFIGPSGCGKSTFLRTLDRMNDLIPNVKITGEVGLQRREHHAPSVDVTWLRSASAWSFRRPTPSP